MTEIEFVKKDKRDLSKREFMFEGSINVTETLHVEPTPRCNEHDGMVYDLSRI